MHAVVDYTLSQFANGKDPVHVHEHVYVHVHDNANTPYLSLNPDIELNRNKLSFPPPQHMKTACILFYLPKIVQGDTHRKTA